jgi:hypothetical protein
MTFQTSIREIHIGYAVFLHFLFVYHGVGLPIFKIPDREFLEIHDILSQSACLIRENVVNGAELLIQIRGLRLSRHIFRLIIDVSVPLDEVRLNKLDDLQGDHQRYWHNIYYHKEPGT